MNGKVKIKIIRFYMGSQAIKIDQAERIEELLQDGYKPLMQLAVSEDSSVWAFIKN